MTLDDVNGELQIIANQTAEEQVAVQYEELMEAIFLQFEMEQYARDCYDLDAEYYGAWK